MTASVFKALVCARHNRAAFDEYMDVFVRELLAAEEVEAAKEARA